MMSMMLMRMSYESWYDDDYYLSSYDDANDEISADDVDDVAVRLSLVYLV